jgi:hypothetical protein
LVQYCECGVFVEREAADDPTAHLEGVDVSVLAGYRWFNLLQISAGAFRDTQ